jgi:hypothetical protein
MQQEFNNFIRPGEARYGTAGQGLARQGEDKNFIVSIKAIWSLFLEPTERKQYENSSRNN